MSAPLRDVIARAIYEDPKADGTVDDWSALSEERKEAWRADADRVIAVLGHVDPRRMRTALLWALGHIEQSEEPSIDSLHDVVAWGLGKQDIRNRHLRAELEDDGAPAFVGCRFPVCAGSKPGDCVTCPDTP